VGAAAARQAAAAAAAAACKDGTGACASAAGRTSSKTHYSTTSQPRQQQQQRRRSRSAAAGSSSRVGAAAASACASCAACDYKSYAPGEYPDSCPPYFVSTSSVKFIIVCLLISCSYHALQQCNMCAANHSPLETLRSVIVIVLCVLHLNASPMLPGYIQIAAPLNLR
jgi:hypothetical protein